ncbi:thioesterase [Carnobacterium maltaromaticum]|uniref:acyl-[acyl-carrier-protein] thioesterase n=1 Tax=Carnobacterium maltaromaticum TaxID=2751 RepID=UPI00298BBAA8|nr:acyl-ACP thioesterase domain-containing protein [Carnobacterium maltaromaticum]MDW5524760.1 thioesterase [Carnobacterium maltaromaticum]
MSGLIYEQKHRIKYYECDATKKISVPMLLNIMLYVSGKQGKLLNVGDDVVAQHGLSWIILQTEINVERLPKANEEITVVTQPQSYNKFFTYREFKVYDEAGELCVTTHCTFAMMDFNKRKMVRIVDELVAPYEVEATKKLVRTPKPEIVNQEAAKTIDYRVRYLDIDANQHVNNAKYLDWFLDSLGLEFIKNHELKSINVKYEKEVSYGNWVQCEVSQKVQEDGRILTAHQINNDGIPSCEASMTWLPL